MRDYTPTAGIVKAAYVNRTHEVYCADPYEVADDFDRWLAEHDRQIAAAAWEEGYADAQHNEHEYRPGRKFTNPYQRGDQQ